jgi:hypothetical protein
MTGSVSATVQPSDTNATPDAGARLLLVALAAAVLFHGGLLPFTHANTYDAFIHMFFGDHYHRSWFDPWEPRWYTGFATTSYPPGTHMAIGALMHVMPLRAAFVTVQMIGILLLTIGVYRFSLLWVPARAAGYAAITLVISSSISETVHLFGQLPTIFSLGVFLNGMPYVYRWIVLGKWANFAAAVAFGAATTAAHHVTTLFGAVLFIVPLGLQALRAVAELNPVGPDRAVWHLRWPVRMRVRPAVVTRFGWPLLRGVLLAVALVGAIVVTIFPYWYWSVTDPITQVSIPHGSRESFVQRLDLGLVFFVLPWGISLLLLPYAVYKTFTTRLWPLGASLLLCALLGTGGTTAIPRALLRGAFDILTLDRFTYWATILILPFIGLMFDGLLHGRSGLVVRASLGRGMHRLITGGLFAAYVLVAVFCAVLPVMRPTQPDFIDPAPLTAFLEQDEHYRWRYLTLGFGDQFAYVSALTTAQSVDGNYHSARRLPDMTRYSVERLENAKYLGVPGLGSLQQFLVNAEAYHLKYVFSNDAFYDPLLIFTGWNRLNRLDNGVAVWERPDVSPLPLLQPRRDLGRVQTVMWGLLPPAALILAAMILFASMMNRGFARHQLEYRPTFEPKASFVRPATVRRVVLGLGGAVVLVGTVGAALIIQEMRRPQSAVEVVEAYYNDLDFRRHAAAYERLDPQMRGTFEDVQFQWRWRGGLIASYGKLVAVRAEILSGTEDLIDFRVHLDWLTALDTRHEVIDVRTVRRGDQWFVVPANLRPVQSPARLQREQTVVWNITGRRQPRPETDLHRDRPDRPQIEVTGVRLVRHKGLFSVVGLAFNADADPAYLTLRSDLRGSGGQVLARQTAAMVNGQRLLPAESTGFRIAFEGVLSLQDAAADAGFDPKLFVPPLLSDDPASAGLEARALVSAANLYRGIALNAVHVEEREDRLHISGTAVNVGTETASVIRLTALVYDMDGQPVWADAGFVDANIMPGQSTPFAMDLPLRDEIEVLGDIGLGDTQINGTGAVAVESGRAPGPADGTIPLNGKGGYASLRLQISTMTYDPEY